MPLPVSSTQPYRTVRRQLILVTLLLAGVFVLALIVTFVGISLQGSIAQWQQWLDNHSGYLFIWRVCLYVSILMAWLWVRRRRLAGDPQSLPHLRRIDAIGALCLFLSEASNWLRLY
ncbi:hypothetical protein [Klebsiella pneumoniae]|uniref:hypothetical protein n=1 Tax=Klebsiella pneumoniae TaxID=573 RepID=UPI001ABCE28F|nr:hypothetical protein [Klebsiella pneumoniae]MBO3721229.1 hypothetical protein [Klebsiella pneumoniae]HCM5830651.1 hypothetical protein [Klebsiella pneumoniae]